MAAGVEHIGVGTGLAVEHGTQSSGGDFGADVVSGVFRTGISPQKGGYVGGRYQDFGNIA